MRRGRTRSFCWRENWGRRPRAAPLEARPHYNTPHSPFVLSSLIDDTSYATVFHVATFVLAITIHLEYL
jgi:hypothetical protein